VALPPLSGVAAAALALAMLWLAFFFVSGTKDPTFTIANIVTYALPGLLSGGMVHDHILPSRLIGIPNDGARWCNFHCGQCCSRRIDVKFLAVRLNRGLAHGGASARPPLDVSESVVLALVITGMGATILIFPYTIVATPIALFHRWLLLILFESSRSPPIYQE
jgi:hypothetical protein